MHRHLFERLALAANTLLALAAAPSAPLAQSSPDVSLSPSSGPPGTSVTVSASGFPPDQTADLLWDGATFLGAIDIVKDGSGQSTITVPPDAPLGWHSVVVCANCVGGGEGALAFFNVVDLAAVTPTPPVPCEQTFEGCTPTPQPFGSPTHAGLPAPTSTRAPQPS